MRTQRRESFERFYYEKVALGEGCGCAEHVTRTRELDALSERLKSGGEQLGIIAAAAMWLRSTVRGRSPTLDP